MNIKQILNTAIGGYSLSKILSALVTLLVCLIALARELVQEVLMLIIRLGEVVDAGRIQRIEIILRLRRVKRGTDGIHAGVRDRARGQARPDRGEAPRARAARRGDSGRDSREARSQEGVTSGLAATDLRTLLHHVCARDPRSIEITSFCLKVEPN